MQLAIEQPIQRDALMVEVVTVGLDLIGAAGPLVFDLKRLNEGSLAGAVLCLNGSGHRLKPVEILTAESDYFISEGGPEGTFCEIAPKYLKLICAGCEFGAEAFNGETPGCLRFSEQWKLLF